MNMYTNFSPNILSIENYQMNFNSYVLQMMMYNYYLRFIYSNLALSNSS